MGYFLITMQRGRCPMKAILKAFQQDSDVKALSRLERDVFRALCFLAGKSNGDCFPHHKTVAQISHYSVPSVKRAIAKLKKSGYIQIQKEYLLTPKGNKLHVRNRYFFKKWAELENGIWNNGIQEWADDVAEIPTKGGLVRQAAPKVDSQEGGGIKMIRGVGSKRSQGSDQNEPLSNSNLSNRNYELRRASLSVQKDGASAPIERENAPKGGDIVSEGEEEEFSSFVTVSEYTTKRLPRAPSATRGAHSARKCYTAKQSCVCECDSKHPPEMPTLEEIYSEMDEFCGGPNEELTSEARKLHDAWLSSGFRFKGNRICDWRAALHGWLMRS
jgi:hypothetical protein